LCLPSYLSAINIVVDEHTNQTPILSKCTIYIDENSRYTIDDALSNHIPFEQSKVDAFTLGYIPNKSVWTKCVFKNQSNATFSKVLLCSYAQGDHVCFYDSKDGYKPRQSGDFHHTSEDTYINPNTILTFEPNEEKTVYIRQIGDIAAVIMGLELWNKKAYDVQNLTHQKVLFLFFGAIIALMLCIFKTGSYFDYACFQWRRICCFYSLLCTIQRISSGEICGDRLEFSYYNILYFIDAKLRNK
jgi:hypothetical protein